MICDEALDLIKAFEGCRLSPYRDAVGVWTIGYGATWGLDGRRVSADHPPLSADQAEVLLTRDAARFAGAVSRLVTVSLAGLQLGALTSFAFNLGAGALQSSTLLRRVNGLEWDDVPCQFMRWVHAGGRRLPGLMRRREAEAALWTSGLWTAARVRDLPPSCNPTSAHRSGPSPSPGPLPALP